MLSTTHIERANALYEQGRYTLAEKDYRNYLSQNPDCSYGHRRLAFCLLKLGKTEEALAESAKAVELSPGDEFAHYCRANVLKNCGQFKEAEAALAEAIALDPDNEEFFVEGAHLALRQGKNDDAITRSQTAITLNPQDFRGYLYKAWGLYGKDKSKEAEPILLEALRLKPDHADSHALQGHLYLHRAKPLEAIQEFREALRLDPTSSLARDGLLQALRSRNPLYGVLGALTWFARPRIPIFLGSAAAVVFAIWLFILLCSAILQSIAPHLLNLCMRFDPVAKHALNEDETFIANALAIWLLVAYAATIILFAFCSTNAIFAPAFFLLYGLPFLFCRIYEFPEGKYRRDAIVYSSITSLFGIAGVICSLFPEHGLPAALSSVRYQSVTCVLLFLVMCICVRLLHAKQARAY